MSGHTCLVCPQAIVKKLVVKKMRAVIADARVQCNGEPFIACILDLWSQKSAQRYIFFSYCIHRRTTCASMF